MCRMTGWCDASHLSLFDLIAQNNSHCEMGLETSITFRKPHYECWQESCIFRTSEKPSQTKYYHQWNKIVALKLYECGFVCVCVCVRHPHTKWTSSRPTMKAPSAFCNWTSEPRTIVSDRIKPHFVRWWSRLGAIYGDMNGERYIGVAISHFVFVSPFY